MTSPPAQKKQSDGPDYLDGELLDLDSPPPPVIHIKQTQVSHTKRPNEASNPNDKSSKKRLRIGRDNETAVYLFLFFALYSFLLALGWLVAIISNLENVLVVFLMLGQSAYLGVIFANRRFLAKKSVWRFLPVVAIQAASCILRWHVRGWHLSILMHGPLLIYSAYWGCLVLGKLFLRMRFLKTITPYYYVYLSSADSEEPASSDPETEGGGEPDVEMGTAGTDDKVKFNS